MTVQISSTGFARFGKRPEELTELLAEAGEAALAGVGRRTVDLLVIGNMAATALGGVENLTPRVADRLGLDGAGGYRVEAASASGAAAFQAAVAAVAAGDSERALVIAGEKMTGLPTAEVARVLAQSLAPSEAAVGATMPALAAIVAQRYQHRYDVPDSAFDLVTVVARRRGARNPNAQFTTPVTAADVAGSRPVAPPLRLLHCAAISDGAVAVVVERGDGPARVLGLGQAFDSMMVVDRPDLTSFRATRLAAQRAYESAHLTRKEIEVLEIHDAFSPFALIDLEDLGICGPGEAAGWFERTQAGRAGAVTVNPSGGILARGHPVGATGLAAIAEVARQLRGEAGALQLDPPPRVGLAQSIGGLASHNFVEILGTGGRS
jgi:acetyl-CoA C-acetyltransferase